MRRHQTILHLGSDSLDTLHEMLSDRLDRASTPDDERRGNVIAISRTSAWDPKQECMMHYLSVVFDRLFL